MRMTAVIAALLLLAGITAALADDAEKKDAKSEPAAKSSGKTVALTSKIKAEFYGYLKLDAAYDTARTDIGDFARWVNSEQNNEDDGQFNMTARESRLGVRLHAPGNDSLDVAGRVEVDFYEGGAANKPRLMMRHAYLQLNWKNSDMSIIAGQTSDVFSPLVAPTVQYTVAWWVGNIGYRRPQLRLTKGFAMEGGHRLELSGALARSIGRSSGFDPGDSGEDAGLPVLQGRIGYSMPFAGGKKAAFGFSGHWGREEYDIDAAGTSEDIDSWSANVDFLIPVADKVVFKGEFFRGENLDAYLGGIGQGVNLATLEAIGSTGGWASLSMGPYDGWLFNFAGSVDDPDDEDLVDGSRARNMSIWGNFKHNLLEYVWWGFEVGYWETQYKAIEDGDSIRIQTALAFTF